ncbi:hypothetical protein M8J77_006718 [Diaphorina citri]|nr:hypothetical protein M8J77_006718 [Diaphorina citri]
MTQRKVLDCTEDSVELQDVLNKLVEIKEDAQQRSWQLHEDEHIILGLVEKLRALLTDADSAICNRVLARDGYSAIETLVTYYQMEPRWSIRQVLLEVFVLSCGLHPLIITALLNSVLPQELGRDIRTSYAANQERVPQSTLLLSCLFCMGEAMPLSHLDQLGADFICFILDGIEKIETDEEETVSDLFLSFLLAYNLQFDPTGSGTSNVVLECLQDRSQANVFTSKLLQMFNREEDPVRLFPHEPAPMHSVLKMMIDLFDNPHTASLFYTNDVKVVIDILVRMINDISSGESKRSVYLDLCRAVLNSCDYAEHRHRSDDLMKCFTWIQEETPPCTKDIELVDAIVNRHFLT